MFEHIGAIFKLTQLLAFGHERAHACLGKKGRDTRAACAQLFSQGALRRELNIQLAGNELTLKLLVFAHIAGDHFLDLPGFKQFAQAKTIDAGIV